MLAGAPPVEKVTLCSDVTACQFQVTTEFSGTVMFGGVKELFATCTMSAEVVVNVTVSGVAKPAAIPVAV